MHDHDPHLPGISWAEWTPLFLIVFLALAYLYVATFLSKSRDGWRKLRSASFIIGVAILAVALHPEMMRSAHDDLRWHMVQHLLIAMFAPIFLVRAAPVTLALQALPVHIARTGTAILKSRIFYILSHPATAMLLNTGGMFALYLTPLYSNSLSSPWLHWLIHFHFLVAGYLFVWSMIGIDPTARQAPHGIKVLFLLLSIGLHAFLSKFMYAYLYPINTPHSADQIREAAKLMYYWGDLSEMLLVIIVFYEWYNTTRIKYDNAPLKAEAVNKKTLSTLTRSSIRTTRTKNQ